MNRIYFIILLGIFLCSCGGGDLAVPKNKIAEVSFPSKETMWIVTRENHLFRLSADGSLHDVEQFAGKAELVFFLNDQKGWVLAIGGHIWSTADGENWEKTGRLTDPGDIAHASQLVFYDTDNGWMRTPSRLLKTNDSGKTWREFSPPFDQRRDAGSIIRFYPKDSSSGWIIFVSGTTGYTEDDGATWEFAHFGERKWDTRSLSCRKDRICLIGTGGDGLFSFPYDNSEGPQRIGGNLSSYLIRSISFSTDETVWAVGNRFVNNLDERVKGILIKSEDEGRTWEFLKTPDENDGYENRYVHIHFTDQENGWLVGEDTVYKTTDGGKEWQKVVKFD